MWFQDKKSWLITARVGHEMIQHDLDLALDNLGRIVKKSRENHGV